MLPSEGKRFKKSELWSKQSVAALNWRVNSGVGGQIGAGGLSLRVKLWYHNSVTLILPCSKMITYMRPEVKLKINYELGVRIMRQCMLCRCSPCTVLTGVKTGYLKILDFYLSFTGTLKQLFVRYRSWGEGSVSKTGVHKACRSEFRWLAPM